MLKEILTQPEQFQQSHQQLLTIMTQYFNHQQDILREEKNLNTNSVDNLANTITNSITTRKAEKLLLRGTKNWQTFSKTNLS